MRRICSPVKNVSLDFKDRTAGIAPHYLLSRAVHEHVEVLEYDRADSAQFPVSVR